MFRFDPRTKVALLLIVNVLMVATPSRLFELVLVCFSALILASQEQWKSSIFLVALFAIASLLEAMVLPLLGSYVFTLLSFVTLIFRKFLPCIMLARWIVTTTQVGEFVAAMWRMRLPLTAIIPLSIVFRYFPTVGSEWESIRNAMRMRGVSLSLEHAFVPLLISAVTISDELSAAALCRGLDAPGGRGSFYAIGFKANDTIFLCAGALLCALSLVFWSMGIW